MRRCVWCVDDVVGPISILTLKETAGCSLKGDVVPSTEGNARLERGEHLFGAKVQ